MDIEQRLFIEEKKKEIPTEGIIEIIPIQPNKFETYRFSTYKKDGLWYGVPRAKKTDGTYEFKKIILSGQTQYNCANPEEAYEAMVVMNHECCEQSPFKNPSDIKWRVRDKIKEAKEEVARIENSLKAVDIARKIKGEELLDFARVLGFSPEIDHHVVIQKKVMERANKNPKEFLVSWNNVNREVVQVLHRALSCNLVRYSPNTGYTWKDGLPLGNSEHEVIVYFLQNERFLNQVNFESKEASNLHETPDVKEKVNTPDPNAANKQINTEKEAINEGAKKAAEIKDEPQDVANSNQAPATSTEQDNQLVDMMMANEGGKK